MAPILFRAGSQPLFVHGFAKNEQANIRADELAVQLLAYDDAALARAVAVGVLMEMSE